MTGEEIELWVRGFDGAYRPLRASLDCSPPGRMEFYTALYVIIHKRLMRIGTLADDGVVLSAGPLPRVRRCYTVWVTARYRDPPNRKRDRSWRVGRLCPDGLHIDEEAVSTWLKAKRGDWEAARRIACI